MIKLIDILNEVLEEKKKKKKADRCLRIARREYDKPSAYRSGAIVRCRRGEIWKNLKEVEEEWEKEYGEIERTAEDENIPLESITQAFVNSREVTLTNDIWEKLENTNSYDCWGDWNCVEDVAKLYNRTSPTVLKAAIESGNYDKPLILKYDERYILVAGNTRLSTAAALKMNPKVLIAVVEGSTLNEKQKETLHGWFKRRGAKGKAKGWVDCNAPDGEGGYKPCGRQKGEERAKYPACRRTPAACKDAGKGTKWGKTK
jgi:hypothetical protein